MPNNLSVAVSADVTDLQVKFAVAKAETNALTSEMNKLAKQSAAGIIDPTGAARLQEVAGDLIKAKSQAASLSAEFKEMTGATQGVGSALEDMRDKLHSAFEITGAAIAVESVMKLGEAIEQLGERAITIRTTSDVLGVTGEQFQAMQIAAEEAGVSMESVTRVAEKMNVALFEARGGSSAATEKLLSLGISTQQIQDPMFKVNDLLGVLHDRLTDAATKQEEMLEITKEFGNRAVLVSEALVKYDGSAQSVAEVMSTINGVTDEQTKKLAEAKAYWGELGNAMSNTASKALVAMTNLLPHTTGSTNPQLLEMETESNEARQNAQEQQDLDKRILQQEMENSKAGIAAFKEGTQERIDQMQIYASVAAKYYGSDTVDTVVKANNEIIGEQRKLDQANIDSTLKSEDQYNAAMNREVSMKLEASNKKITEDARYLDSFKASMDGLVDFAERTDLEVTNKHAELQHSLNEINSRIAADADKSAKAESKSWQGVVGEIEGSESSLISNVLSGRRGLSQSLIQMSGELATKELADDAKAITTKLLLRTSAATSEKALEQGGLLYHLFASNAAAANDMQKQAAQTSATVASQAAQTNAVAVGNTTRNAATASAQAASQAVAATTGAAVIQSDAAKAFAGVYASVAQIPYVGWIMAPEAAAAAMAEVEAFSGMASLATGTNYVPQDMIAQIHEGERIVPKAYNPDAGGQGGGGTSYSEEHNYTGDVHVHAFDAQSMSRMMNKPGGRSALVGGGIRAYRRGAR